MRVCSVLTSLRAEQWTFLRRSPAEGHRHLLVMSMPTVARMRPALRQQTKWPGVRSSLTPPLLFPPLLTVLQRPATVAVVPRRLLGGSRPPLTFTQSPRAASSK